MTLPASGTITFNNVNVELGVSGTTTRSLNDSAVRTLAAVPSGAISMSNLHGKSAYTAPVWNYAAGTHNPSAAGSVSVTVTSTKTVTWTYSTSGDTGYLSISIGSGASATSLDMTLVTRPDFDVPDLFYTTFATVTLSATDGTTTRNWTFNLTATA